jgi:hypothetical protein
MGNWLSAFRQPDEPDPSVDPYEHDQYPIMGKYVDRSTRYPTGMSFRLHFGQCPVVTGYPSTGGYLERRTTGVEIEWLGLDKMHESYISKEQPEEDNFCLKLRKLGAKWWEESGLEFSIEQLAKTYPDGEIEIHTGWPSDGEGVWVLRTKQKECDRGRAAVRQCKTMDERARLIKELGGTFYRDSEECPELSSDWGEIPCVVGKCGHLRHPQSDPRVEQKFLLELIELEGRRSNDCEIW